MQERILTALRNVLDRIKEWWGKFTPRQKTIIVGLAAAVIMAFVILIVVLTTPKYVPLLNCEDTKQASEVTQLLDDNGIAYSITDDGLSISVLEAQQSDANLLLGANDIQSSAYTIDNVTDGGFSTTESDKQKRYVVYLENRLERDFISKFDAIKSAHVELNVPEDDGTLIADSREASAAIILELQDEFTTDQAAYLATAVATALGNSDSTNITIMDTAGNMLYSGEDSYSLAGSANSQLSVKAQAENLVKSEVKQVLRNTNLFDQIEVASNLDIDFSTYEQTNHNYTPADGQTQGVLSEADEYSSESTSGLGGVPGTDSNQNDTTYVFQNNNGSSNSTTENSYKYLPNEAIINQSRPAGEIKYANSSISVTAISYNVVREEDAKSQGLLDGIKWSDYKTANAGRTKMDVDTDLYSIVANATGISESNITILAYEENLFLDKSGGAIGVTDILQIILIVIILGLLGFVVLRSMRREKEPEQEPELSVESMLQSTPMDELENIEVESKSETRKMIEKFVDENPEAAANLLRNWLNEEWG